MSSLKNIFPTGFRPPVELPILPPEHQLRVAMSDAGIQPPDDIVLDGTLRRFSTTGKKKDLSGWYVIHDGDIPAGAFGDWKTGQEVQFRADIGRDLTFQESAIHHKRMAELKAKREKEVTESREYAAFHAAKLWESAQLASDDHPYIKRKGITNPGWRIAPDGRLIAPMMIDGEIRSLQYIDSDGSKMFLKGGQAGGAWWSIGPDYTKGDGRIYFAEGIATAASIFEATGKSVVVTYSAGNMSAVIQSVRASVGPLRDLVIVADHDESGVGKREADKAALLAGASVIMTDSQGDANDFAQAGGDLAGLLEPVTKDMRYTLTLASEMTEMAPIKWHIKKILPAKEVAAIYGPPGAGKSFMALDMACHIAEGRDWMGFRTKRANVVYLVLEAANGFSGRLKAWQIHSKRSLPDNFFVIKHSPFAFSSPLDIKQLVESIEYVIRNSNQGLIIFIDTLARAMGSFDENDNNDMGKVVAAAETISKSLDCAVSLIAHPGKDTTKGLRGGSSLLGGLETTIELNKDSATKLRTWKLVKQKEGDDGIEGSFNLQVVKMGEDDDGDDITSAVVVHDASEVGFVGVKPEPKSAANARKSFEGALLKYGYIDHQGSMYITTDNWAQYEAESNRHIKETTAKQNVTKTTRYPEYLEGYIKPYSGGYIVDDESKFYGIRVLMREKDRN